MIYAAAFSGGADSTAMLCHLVERGQEFVPVFCDTGWEAPETYSYIEEINSGLLGGRLVTLRSSHFPGGMAELVQIKRRVPSIKARFCTQHLKIMPMIEWVKQQEDEVEIFQGYRADESLARQQLREREWSDDWDAWLTRPILLWTKQQCFDIIRRHGLDPNPLYRQGARRVGCFPCVLITHGELRRLTETRPEIWERIAQLERAAGGRSFFPPNYIPYWAQTGYDPKSGQRFPTVEDVRRYVLRLGQGKLFDDGEPVSCMSIYGLCE